MILYTKYFSTKEVIDGGGILFFFCSGMPINRISQPHCRNSTQDLVAYARQSGLVLSLRNFGGELGQISPQPYSS